MNNHVKACYLDFEGKNKITYPNICFKQDFAWAISNQFELIDFLVIRRLGNEILLCNGLYTATRLTIDSKKYLNQYLTTHFHKTFIEILSRSDENDIRKFSLVA